MKIAALIAPLVFLATPVYAGFHSGNSLHSICSEPQASFASGVCLGYVLGLNDTYEATGIKFFCAPETVTAGQLMDIATKYLKDHPEARHYTAASQVSLALSEAFPC